MSCLRGKKGTVGWNSGDWAFSEAGKDSEERGHNTLRSLKTSRDSNRFHEFNRLEFKPSQPN